MHGLAQDSRSVYIVMEYVNGGELFTYLRSERKLSLAQAQLYAAQMVLALEHLHARNIVYR